MQDKSFRCTGNGPATHVDCPFVGTTMESAVEHFETTGHDVAVPETVCTLCNGTGDIDIDDTLTVKCSECLGTGNADAARENALRDQAATDAEIGQWNPYAWAQRNTVKPVTLCECGKPATCQGGTLDNPVAFCGPCMTGEPAVDLNDRDSLIAWHVWNDPNGCYRDADMAVEGSGQGYWTLEELRALYEDAQS